MKIQINDPLFLTALDGGQVITPSKAAGASNSGPLEYAQRAVEIGEPVPIAFARRVNNNGGVFISPGASEARFDLGGTVGYSAGTVLTFGTNGRISIAPNGSICDATIAGGTVYGGTTVGSCITFPAGGDVLFPAGGTVTFLTGGSISGAKLTTSSATFSPSPVHLFAYYHLPLSEGVIDDIPVKDVFQASCRVGSHTQTYNRRAGSWAPGNFVSQKSLPSDNEFLDLPQICGSVGLYPDISTLSFVNNTNIYDANAAKILNQVHIFIRGGMHVTRLLDSVTGPSDNFADLAKWMLQRIERVPDALIDNTSLLQSAQFLNANGFTCNTYITKAQNYEQFISEWAPYFLLQPTKINGKRGLKPVLPINANGTINTDRITWEYTFNEELIVSDSFELEYTSLVERTPFVVQAIWRQQPDDDAGLVRTAEIRYANTAPDGPYESHDLSAFCTSEDHAVKAGTYILSSRLNATHVIRFAAAPQAHSYLLGTGSIIRVTLKRHASGFAESELDYLYRIIQIGKSMAGEVTYECIHFPIDSLGRSIVALDVAGAVGAGYTIQTIRTGVNCDAPTSTSGSGGSGTTRKDDETVPEEEYIEPGDANDPSDWEPTYQWYADDAAIDGEINSIYIPAFDDIGSELYLETTFPDGTVVESERYVITDDDVDIPLDFEMGTSAGTSSSILGSGEVTVDGADSPFATVGSGATYSGADLPISGDIGTSGAAAGGGEDGIGTATSNPSDGLGLITAPAITGTLVAGNTLSYDPGCPGAFIEWRLVTDATGEYQVVSSGVAVTYLATEAATAAGVSVVGVGRCPDPSAPGGYGPEIISPPAKVQFNPALYLNFRWTGTLRKRTNFGTGPLSDIPITSGWRSTGNSNYGYIILRGFTGSPSTFVTLNSGPWGANLAFYLDGTAGFSGSSCGYVQDNNSGGSINYMQEFGGFVAQEQNGNLAFEATNGKWQFSNVQSPSNNTIPIAEWGGA